MAITLQVAGTDYTKSVDRNTLRIEDILTRQINRCQFVLRSACGSLTAPTVGQEVKVRHDSDLIFAGVVVKVTHHADDYKVIRYKVECNDYGRLLGRKLLNDSFENQTIETIIRNALSTLNTMDVFHNMDTYDGDGTWTADGASDALNVTTDTTIYKRGSGCVNYDVDVSQSANNYADVYIDDMTAVNLAEYDSNGYFFMWYYIPDSTNVIGFTFRWGSDSSNYWSDTVTTQHDETSFADGWNILRFSWKSAAQAGAMGSPNSSALDYAMLRISYSAGQTDMTDCRIDDIVCGYLADLEVDCPNEADYVAFRYEQFDNVLTQLADIVNYDWYIDYGRVINFFGKTDNTASFDIQDDDGSYIFKSLVVRRDDSQKKNVIYVRGGEYLGSALAPKYVSDGEQQVYALGYKYDDLLVTVTGTTWDGVLEGQGDESAYDYVWDREEKRLKFRSDRIPSVDSVITLHGSPYLPVRVKLRDQNSIDATKTAEGGDGEYEYVIIDQTINTREGARERARAELDAYKDTLSEGEFETYTDGLRSGQRIRINSSAHSIDEYFIINKVIIVPWTHDSPKYKVSLVTTKTLGIIEYLIQQTIANKKEIIINENEILDVVETFDETVTLTADYVTSTSHNAQTESLSVTETTVTAQSLNWDIDFVYADITPTNNDRNGLFDGAYFE